MPRGNAAQARKLVTTTGKRGGKRNGAGRKTSAATELRDRLPEEKIGDAEYAIALYVSVMRDTHKTMRMRLAAADWVAKRILGQPKQEQEVKGNVNMTVDVKMQRYREAIEKVYGPIARARAANPIGTGTIPDDGGGRNPAGAG